MTFELNEFQFEPISAKKNINTEYYKDILKLIHKHKNVLLDDYLPQNAEDLINLIDDLYPWFFIMFKHHDFLGYMYCHTWYGDKERKHSCYLTSAAIKRFYGKDTRKVLCLFCNYLFDALGLVKVRAEVKKENALCIKLLEDCRFKKEGYLKSNTLLNGKPQDMLVYGKINPAYLRSVNHRKEI